MSEPSLASILGEHPYLSLTANNRILCSVTNHEMPPRADAVLSHLNGKKFKKAKEWYNYDYDEFLPHIVPDRNNKLKLHCKLTRQTLNKIPVEVRKHVSGKKFLRLKNEFEEKQTRKANPVVKEKEDDDDSDIGSDVWMPPDDELFGGDEDADEPKRAKREKKGKTTNKVVEEDTLSDLVGSDHDEEEFYTPNGEYIKAGEAYDFDELDGDDNGDDDEEEEDEEEEGDDEDEEEEEEEAPQQKKRKLPTTEVTRKPDTKKAKGALPVTASSLQTKKEQQKQPQKQQLKDLTKPKSAKTKKGN